MKLRTIVANLSLLLVSILLVLLIAEVASRYMVPISPGLSFCRSPVSRLSIAILSPIVSIEL